VNPLALEKKHGVRNYAPLNVSLVKGRGAEVWDDKGKRYLDFLSAYSALNQGHCHPAIVKAAKKQLGVLTLTSRAFFNALLGRFLQKICKLTRQDRALPMNSGAEAVESAIKAMRLWGYKTKGIPDGCARIIVAEHNFHGRTTTIVGFSSDPDSYHGFGPATPGFVKVPYGDAAALEAAITEETCGVLLEPIQGEAGVKIPPAGYLKQVREICTRRNVLFCADEIQTGLGRTGKMLAVEHEGVRPDLITLGKALSGGFYPISAVAGKDAVLGLFTPGTHGSTFGGNPLACAIGLAALDVLEKEKLAARSAKLGAAFLKRLKTLRHPKLLQVRGRGLLLAIEFSEPLAKDYSKLLLKEGLLAKDTHGTTVRLAPPLMIPEKQLDEAFQALSRALDKLL
jgi:ornithine--oxo-acid transaminase